MFLISNMIPRSFVLLLFFPFLGSIAIAGSNPKQAGSGIFDLLPGDTVQKPVKDLPGKLCWWNPNIAGVVLRGSWAKIQRAADQYDWTYLDTGVALAEAHNKKVSISIHCGVDSPEWIYSQGAKRLRIPGYGTMPLPWDPVFKKYWAAFVQQLGAKYDSVSVVAYITMGGPGRLEENFICTTRESVQEFNAKGGVPMWTTAAEAITDMYAAAFPNTPFLYAYGSPGAHPRSSDPFSQVTSYAVGAYPGRYGIKSDALNPDTSPTFWPSIEIPSLSPTTTVGYQMLVPFKGRQIHGGTLADALNIGLSNKAHFIEVYDPDCNDPNEQSTISVANQQLLSAYP
jgi:hypothetical protein